MFWKMVKNAPSAKPGVPNINLADPLPLPHGPVLVTPRRAPDGGGGVIKGGTPETFIKQLYVNIEY